MRVCIFPQFLYLKDVSLFPSGQVASGQVINGGWWFRSNGDYGFSYHSEDSGALYPVNHFKMDEQRVVPIAGRDNDYNEVLYAAKSQPHFSGTVAEMKAQYDIPPAGTQLDFEDFDDDISF